MTSTAHMYENFAQSLQETPAAPSLSEEEVEDVKLASFEVGYSSGWEDALRAHEDSKTAVSTALKDCLDRASLSRDSAFDQFVASAEMLIDGIVKQILPAISQEVLGQHIRDILVETAQSAIGKRVVISVSPQDFDSMEKISGDWLPEAAELRADSSLKTGQADLSLGDSETHVDLAEVISEVSRAVDAFFHIAKETSSDDG